MFLEEQIIPVSLPVGVLFILGLCVEIPWLVVLFDKASPWPLINIDFNVVFDVFYQISSFFFRQVIVQTRHS